MDRDHDTRRAADPGAASTGAHDAALRALRALADSSGSGEPADVVTSFVHALPREFPDIEVATISPSAADDPSPWGRFIPAVEREAERPSAGFVERIPIRLGRAIPLSLTTRFRDGSAPDAAVRSALRSLGPIVSLFADLALASAESRGIVRMRTRLVESLASGASIAAESIRQLIFTEFDPADPAVRSAPPPAFAAKSDALAPAPPDGWPFRPAEPRFDLRDVVGRMRGWLGAFLASRGSALRISLGPLVPQTVPGSAEAFGTALFEVLEAITTERPRSPVLVRIDGSPDGIELLFDAGFETQAPSPAPVSGPAPAPGKERPLWLAPLFFLRRGGRFDETSAAGGPPRSVRGRMPCAEATVTAARPIEPLPSRLPAPAPSESSDAPLVLVVDDEVYARYTIRCLLEREGFRVETAGDGEEGYAAARASRPAIVIMDLSMPRCDGLEAAKRMRADASLRALPLLAMTARSKDTAIAEALGAGFDGIIQKPFFLPELLSVVRHWLGERPAERQPGI